MHSNHEFLKVTYKSGIQPFAVLPSILTTRFRNPQIGICGFLTNLLYSRIAQ